MELLLNFQEHDTKVLTGYWLTYWIGYMDIPMSGVRKTDFPKVCRESLSPFNQDLLNCFTLKEL